MLGKKAPTDNFNIIPKELAGYHPLESLSGVTQNSSVGSYIKDNLSFSRRDDLSRTS